MSGWQQPGPRSRALRVVLAVIAGVLAFAACSFVLAVAVDAMTGGEAGRVTWITMVTLVPLVVAATAGVAVFRRT